MRQELLETVMANEKARVEQEKTLLGVRTELNDTKSKLEELMRKYGLLEKSRDDEKLRSQGLETDLSATNDRIKVVYTHRFVPFLTHID